MKSRFSVLLTVLLFVAGGFVFAQDSGDVGKSWQVIYSNPLSSEGWSGVDRSPVTVSSDYVHVASTTLSGCVLEGLPYCYGVMDAQAGDYLYVTVDLPEAGDYKFSYRGRLEADSASVVARLQYGTGEEFATVVSPTYSYEPSDELPGTLMESSELSLEAGKYNFCVYVEDAEKTAYGDYFFIGDFILYQYKDTPVPDYYTLSYEGENCTVRVRDFDTFADYDNGAQLEEGSRILVSADADEGWQVTSLQINGQEWTTYDAWEVTGDVHVTAVAERLEAHTLTWRLEGDDCGSMRVFDSYTGEDLPSGIELFDGRRITAAVTMDADYVDGTLVANGKVTEFNNPQSEGYFTKTFIVTSDLDIVVSLTEKEPPTVYHDVTYTVTGGEYALSVSVGDATEWEVFPNGSGQIADGHELLVSVRFQQFSLMGRLVVNGEVYDEFTFGSCMGEYLTYIEVHDDIDLEIELYTPDSGVQQAGDAASLSVSPTLFESVIEVTSPAPGTAALYGIDGVQVMSAVIVPGANVIGTGALQPGHYVLRVECGGEVVTTRLLKR